MMLSPYRRVLAEPGALLFSATGFVARLPMSMVGLGIVLLVSDATGSYGLAGSVAAAYVVANAGFAIVIGRLVDRLGQSRVLPVAVSLCTTALALTTWSVEADWPRTTTYLLAAVAGAAIPPIGSCIRARWSHVLDEPDGVQTAYALESVVDESVFILGPIVVTVLATWWHPVAGLAAAALAGLAGTLALAAQRATEPPPHPRQLQPADGADRESAMPWALVATLTGICFALGMVFGGAEVATVAFADEHAAREYAGPLLALWALGSLVSGVLTGLIRWRRPPATRVRWGVLALGLTLLPLTVISSMPLLGLALLLGGFAISPTLISALALTEQSVPRGRLTEGMAVLHTGLAAGIAPGATLTGVVVDASGAATAYAVPAAAGLAGALLAFAALRDRISQENPLETGPSTG